MEWKYKWKYAFMIKKSIKIIWNTQLKGWSSKDITVEEKQKTKQFSHFLLFLSTLKANYVSYAQEFQCICTALYLWKWQQSLSVYLCSVIHMSECAGFPSYPLSILQKPLVGLLLAEVLQVPLSVREHGVHVRLVLHCQLQCPYREGSWHGHLLNMPGGQSMTRCK